MTAEIAVMNRIGVALAADSAVTIGGPARKIYTSAEKLFQLSEFAPVGIMVYGSADYVTLPWETIIKVFRRKLAKRTHPTIAEYCEEFVAFLHDNPELFPEENRGAAMKWLLSSLLSQVRKTRKRRLDEKRKAKAQAGNGPLTKGEIDEGLAEAISELADVVSDDEVPGLDGPRKTQVEQFTDQAIAELLAEMFEGVEVSGGDKTSLIALGIKYLCHQSLRDYTSGIVIAGFGEKEYAPSLANFEVEECVGTLPRLKPTTKVVIGPKMPSFVMPYAQQDSVFQFLLGVDTEISGFMSETVGNMTRGLVDLVIDKVSEANADLANDLRDPIRQTITDKLKELFESWEDQQNKYFRPVLGTIAVLPKEELAAMAEAFVNLTKFRRRVTPVAETVSGPIDVAVITKGDGFVWIRRKHYFSPEVNPRVMARFHNPGANP